MEREQSIRKLLASYRTTDTNRKAGSLIEKSGGKGPVIAIIGGGKKGLRKREWLFGVVFSRNTA
ncbi:hypothetical protein [Acidiferrobacter sp.]|uniref:hypothetical protein n=1 Tax=Acidiferrobacter sp. TaxID=1872107 RepID=UPI00261CEFAD|nr:hypothetical protein [Acidiferrobacter sp.]